MSSDNSSGKMSGSDFAYEKLCEKMENTKQCDQESREVYGPILPPHLLEKADRVSKADLGSSIPSHLQDSNTFETTIQANILDDSTEDMIGPLPITKSDPLTETQLKLEQRALEIKLQGLENEKNTKKETSREDWMLTLPEVMSSKSLYPTNRKFRTTDGPDFSDRSCWTDIPGKKSYNQDVKVSKTDIKEEEIKQHQLLQRPKKKKQPEKSLLEIHQEKLKAKKAKHPGELERRPFNREIDLQNGRSNPANIKSLIQKAQYLDGKFGSGQGKYL